MVDEGGGARWPPIEQGGTGKSYDGPPRRPSLLLIPTGVSFAFLSPPPFSSLFETRASPQAPFTRIPSAHARPPRIYIYIYKTLLPFRDRPDSPSCHVIDQHPDRAPSCFATKDWTTQKTVAKSPISTFIELRCSTDSQPPTTVSSFVPSIPLLFFFFVVPSLLAPPSVLERRSRSNAAYDASST